MGKVLGGGVLEQIFNETEDSPLTGKGLALRKHSKNLSIVAFSQVCKTWNLRIVNSGDLWGNISFDNSDNQRINVKVSRYGAGNSSSATDIRRLRCQF